MMAHQEDNMPPQHGFQNATPKHHSVDNYSEDRSPQYKVSNEPASSIADRRVALNVSRSDQTYTSDVDDDDGFDMISYGEVTASRTSSETTGSDDTVVNSLAIVAMAATPVVPGSALTKDNMNLLDTQLPLGNVSTYQWIWGQSCPGGFDIKDNSSKDSMKVHISHSRVSRATDALENEYGMANHPSEAFIACAGDWADVAARPAAPHLDL
ncbi:hypothetical protein CORC01_08888 [Colletotrichum orchidophilum]|uniref:Uncharacterized protein n=1 Tax=Colletotrichum orchidophilum TaxID=1209926 RepID=A0A1G4B2X8_9PEZI|nr:uncharacterized protein CORC01_08888 [Colletotrichum orchidophilum]OHE95747.1 hypothetical protein CORC01_08888 [Colletotrichum orchidophilum]